MKIKLPLLLAVILIVSVFAVNVFAEEAKFELNQKLSIVNLKSGENVKKVISITSKSAEALKLSIAVEGAQDVVKLAETNFDLQPQAQKQVDINFVSDKLGVNTGKFVISTGSFKKELPFIEEVWSVETEYAPKIDIPAEFRGAKSGYDLNFRMSVLSSTPKENKIGRELSTPKSKKFPLLTV